VREFGEESVFGLEAGGGAANQDLEVRVAAPEAVCPGREFNLGIVVRNASTEPFALAEEEPQPLQLEFLDPSGVVAYRESGNYQAPFFLASGESQVLPYRSRGAPPEGDYRLRISLRGGVLGEREFLLPVRVEEMPHSLQPGRLDGRVLRVEREDDGALPPDGLFPLVLEVENGGDSLWIVAKKDRQDDLVEPQGLVRLGVRWFKDGQQVWEEERCTLPCDISPGQRVEVPSLVRPPLAPGRYHVQVGLLLEGGYWFGEALQFEVEITAWEKAETKSRAA
jgi:hypothetical protein